MASRFELKKLSNEELLKRYQTADPNAFEEFFERTHLLVFNFLLHRLGSRQLAEDVLQETYLKVHSRILSYDPERNALTWVMSIAKNAGIDARRKRTESPLPEDFDIGTPASAEASLAARQILETMLGELSSSERDLFISRFFDNDSYEEIAERTGASLPSLRKRFSRMIGRLKASLDAS